MAFYESVFIIRQDISSAEADRIIDDFTKIIKDYEGKILKTEYWGFRSLAYRIANNKKGYYYFLGIEASNPLLEELTRKVKLNEDVIRHSLIKVKEISIEPSLILQSKEAEENTEIEVDVVDVDVTPDKKLA